MGTEQSRSRAWKGWLQAFVLCLVVYGGGELIAGPAENADCFLCHKDQEEVILEGPRAGTPIYVDEEIYDRSVHAELTCLECHETLDVVDHPDSGHSQPVDCTACHEDAGTSFDRSAHAGSKTMTVNGETITSPACADCHGKHDILSPLDIDSSLHFLRLGETCGQCHEGVYADLRASVHGNLKARGRKDSPVCTDCHQEHAIQPVSAAAAMGKSGEVCSQCHASERINTKYGLPVDRVDSFFDSYHGLATKLGDAAVANCASCHGYHLILESSDPRSSIHPLNLPLTCGECHPGASTRFASGSIHHPSAKPGESDLGGLVNFWVERIYQWLIVATIGLMLVHNALSWRKHLRRHLENPARTAERMNRHLRIQHALLAISFIYLAISGFALAYPDSFLSWMLGSSEPFRRWSHRITGVFMILLGIYHLGYLGLTATGRKLFRDMLPVREDFAHLWQNIRYFLSSNGNKPRFRRFGYAEKLEYYAVFWGSFIMAVTGLAIWLKMLVTTWLPRWVVEVAITIHFYEAILAVLAIIVWHIYHVIFAPGTYPMNAAWLDGKVTPEWMEDEHPLDESSPGGEPEDRP